MLRGSPQVQGREPRPPVLPAQPPKLFTLRRAAGQAVTAAEQAADAFTASDGVRDAALAAYRVACREALAGAVTLRQR